MKKRTLNFLLPLLIGVCIGALSTLTFVTLKITDGGGMPPMSARIILKAEDLRGGGHIRGDNRTDVLYNTVRVLCMVLTTPTTIRTKGVTVLATWGRRCNKFLLINDRPLADLPTMNVTVQPGYGNLHMKTSEAFLYAWRQYGAQFDWFLKADDDTYVVVDNLRWLLKNYSPDAPLFFGERFEKRDGFRGSPLVYPSGGAGYVFNRAALRRYAEESTEVCTEKSCPEDLLFGARMRGAGVAMGDSRDSLNRSRFHSSSASYMLSAADDVPQWFRNMAVHFRGKGLSHMSDRPITFHYTESYNMRVMDYLIYRVKCISEN